MIRQEVLKLAQDYVSGEYKVGNAYGICYHLDYQMGVLNPIFMQWPKFSGDLEFPIRTNKKLSGRTQYNSRNLWDKKTPYGRARWELLNFIITELEKELSIE